MDKLDKFLAKRAEEAIAALSPGQYAPSFNEAVSKMRLPRPSYPPMSITQNSKLYKDVDLPGYNKMVIGDKTTFVPTKKTMADIGARRRYNDHLDEQSPSAAPGLMPVYQSSYMHVKPQIKY
jgi:hypothetical protein